MAAIVTNKFRIHNAEQFYESFGGSSSQEASGTASTYYLFVGRPQQFSTTTGGGTDASPPTPIDNPQEEYRHFRDMLAAKKVATSDVSFVVPRRTWTVGIVYDEYRHDYSSTNQSTSSQSTLFDSTFYVMTDEYKVYKCMFNNSGAVTVTKPTSTSNTEFTTATDNYKWKYMYTMSTTQVQNFLTADFMPVVDTKGTITGISQSTVSSNAVNGEIRHIKITTAGVGYTNATYPDVPIRGDGTSGVCTVTIAGGAVTAVAVTTQGTNYTYATVYVDGISSVGSPSTSAVLTPIVGPTDGGSPVKGGHGYDALKELGAFYVMTNTSLTGAEGSDFVTGQDFRRIGLVRNPYNYGTIVVASAATRSALKSVTFAASPTPGTFTNDEIITGGTSGAKGLVVDWNSTTRVLSYVQTDYTGVDTNKNLTAFSASAEVVTGASSSATGTTSAVSNPEIDYYSGDIMYVEHRAPIMRATDQTENVKLVIEF